MSDEKPVWRDVVASAANGPAPELLVRSQRMDAEVMARQAAENERLRQDLSDARDQLESTTARAQLENTRLRGELASWRRVAERLETVLRDVRATIDSDQSMHHVINEILRLVTAALAPATAAGGGVK